MSCTFSKKVTLGVVVPNHNGGHRLRVSLEQLLALPLVDRVVLVDDRSTDASDDMKSTERLSVVKNRGRKGFAATANVGIRYLLQEVSPPYIAVANNDLDFDASLGKALERGLDHLSSHPGTYLCGFNDGIDAKETIVESGVGLAQDAATVSGSLMLFRSSVFLRIGLMSEGYFMYGEENDYFDRMRRNGLGLVLINSPIRHEGEGSRLPGLKTTWLAHRNALRRAIKTFQVGVVAETLGSLVVMPWFRDQQVIRTHLSLMRTLRFGPLVGSALGVASAGWNLLNVATTIRERLAEDRQIQMKTEFGNNSDQSNR